MSNVGAGLRAQFGIAQETTPGTAVTPTRFFGFSSESTARKRKVVQAQVLGGGRTSDLASYRYVTQVGAAGDLTLPLPAKGFGLLLQHMIGSFSATATQVGTSMAYKQVHTPDGAGAFAGKALTLQKGVPGSAVQPFTYPGAKITAWELDCKQSDIVTAKLTFDAIDELTPDSTPPGEPLAISSYTESPLFTFVGGSLLVGGTVTTTSGVASVTGGTAVAAVTGVNVKGSNAFNTDLYYLGSTTKAEQIQNNWSDPQGQIDMDFTDLSLYDQYASDAGKALHLTFTGPDIDTGNPYTLDVLIPHVRLEDGASPQVGGPDVVSTSVPFTGLDDQTNPVIQFTYISSDTAV